MARFLSRRTRGHRVFLPIADTPKLADACDPTIAVRTRSDNGTRWATSAAFGDLDGDGYPDLYVCYYVDWSFANDPKCVDTNGVQMVCAPQKFEPLPHRLYRNNGDGTFQDKTNSAKLRPDGKSFPARAEATCAANTSAAD